MSDLPPGFEQIVSGDVSVTARSEDAQFVNKAVQTHRSLHRYAAATESAKLLGGRAAAHVISVNGSKWIVRHYMRGGMIASLLGDRYVRSGTPRPVAELIVSEAARQRGIPTPAVRAAVVYEGGMFYRADIATSFIEGSADLAELTLGERAWPDDARVSAWRAAGAAIRMCFENGLLHPDLNLRNVIVERGDSGVRAYVIDLDRAHLGDAVSASARQSMMSRFERSMRKIERAAGRSVSAEDRRAFHEGLGQ
jgi:3-deoxy-D-manno-octulosonic acid kinase